MNERIYEIATKAGAYCETYLHGGDPKPPILDNMDLEKFAELIVRECIVICESGTPTQTTSGGAAELIKMKFGVK